MWMASSIWGCIPWFEKQVHEVDTCDSNFHALNYWESVYGNSYSSRRLLRSKVILKQRNCCSFLWLSKKNSSFFHGNRTTEVNMKDGPNCGWKISLKGFWTPLKATGYFISYYFTNISNLYWRRINKLSNVKRYEFLYLFVI